VQLREHVALAPYTTLGLGGKARYFVECDSEAEVRAALSFAAERRLPAYILGGGSNVVFLDSGFPGLILRITIGGMELRDGPSPEVRAGAGVDWDTLVQSVVQRGWTGVECLSGIPGTVGGTPIQNVGAYGQDVSGVIADVTAFDTANGVTVTIPAAECGFAYRASRFKGSDAGRFVVCAVRFRLQKGPPTTAYAEVASALAREGVTHPSVADVRAAVLAVRRRKAMVIDASDPDTRSVGSFFTNPVLSAGDAESVAVRAGAAPPVFPQAGGQVKVPAAWLIERAGYVKGTREGAVGLSSKHTLAIVTRDGATAADVIRFACRVAQRVEARFGVRLRPEPVLLGFAGSDVEADVEYLLGARN